MEELPGQKRPRAVVLARATAAGTATEPLLTKGSSGERVTQLQANLNALGIPPELNVDGILGNNTLAAVRFFQSSHELEVDGIVGPDTRGMIARELIEHGDPSQLGERAGAPCHTPDAPGPDDAEGAVVGRPEDPTATTSDGSGHPMLGFALTEGNLDAGGGGSVGAPPQPTAAGDFAVQLTNDPHDKLTPQLTATKASAHKVCCDLATLKDTLRGRTIGTLYIISHAYSDGEIWFQCGGGAHTAMKLADMAAAINGLATVKRVVFLACSIGNDPTGLEAVRAALNADSAEGGTCHYTQQNVGLPPLASGKKVTTKADFNSLAPETRTAWLSAVRNNLKTLSTPDTSAHPDCLAGSPPGKKLDDLSDDQLKDLVLNGTGVAITEYASETDECWKDLEYGGVHRCRKVQAVKH